jgi:acetyl esterase/lipase
MTRWWKAAQLLLKNMGIGTLSNSDPIHLTTQHSTGYHLYQPSHKYQRTILLVYGMTIAGENEIRLVHFARALATCGFRVVVPNLAGMKSYDFDSQDLDRLADLITEVASNTVNRIGIIGFSAGGTLSLLVASRPELAGLIRVLLLFSPCVSLEEAWKRLQLRISVEPEKDTDWDDYIWGMCVLAYKQREQLKFSHQEILMLEQLLTNYCIGVSDEEKRDLYFNFLRSRNIQTDISTSVDPETWEIFSPRGKLSNFKGRVMILHDPQDPWAPPQHSKEIINELELSDNSHRARLIVSPLISHVTPRYLLRFWDLYNVVNMVGEIFP